MAVSDGVGNLAGNKVCIVCRLDPDAVSVPYCSL